MSDGDLQAKTCFWHKSSGYNKVLLRSHNYVQSVMPVSLLNWHDAVYTQVLQGLHIMPQQLWCKDFFRVLQ